MIRGVHTMFYTSQPDELRRFFRDTIGLPAFDVGGGWLIFELPEADLGCHPADDSNGARSGTPHISFYCDDIKATVAKLSSRGVEFTGPVEDQGYGLVTHFNVPGDFTIQLYQPRYAKRGAAKRATPAKKRPSAAKKAKPKTARAAARKPRKAAR